MKKIGGDTGYAGTDNRDHCRDNDIQTSFVKRGCPSAEKKDRDFVRAELARVRRHDGGLDRDIEGARRSPVSESQEEGDGDLVHLSRIRTASVVSLAGRQLATG